MNVQFLIQARSGSTRYPNKIFENIFDDLNLLDIIIHRTFLSKYADKKNLIVLTTSSQKDDSIAEYLSQNEIKYFRGSEEDVHLRYFDYLNSENNNPDFFFRICSDNPFLEPLFIDEIISYVKDSADYRDYYSFKDAKNTPAILTHYGFFAELIKTDSFLNSRKYVNEKHFTEHVTPIFYNSDLFKSELLEMPEGLRNLDIRLTFDTKEDLQIIRKIYAELNSTDFSYLDVLEILKKHPDILSEMKKNINKNTKR